MVEHSLLVAAILLASGCGEAGSSAADAVDVPLYHGEEDLRIGSVEGDGPDGFGRVSGLAIDASERLFVVDLQANDVRVFDEAGDYLFTAGRAGNGPGELRSPCCAGVAPDGLLWVRDSGNGRYVAFELREDGPRGVVTRRMNHADGSLHVRTTFGSEGQPIDIGSRPDAPSGERRTVLFHLGADGGVVREVLAPLPPDSDEIRYAVTMMGGAMTRYFRQPFGPRHLLAVGPDGMYAEAVSSTYEVRWYSPEGDVFQLVSAPDAVGPPLTADQRSRADSMIAADEQFAGQPMPFSAPERHSVITALHFDDEGHLWVERTASPGEPRPADVYGFDGELLRRVEIPAEIDLTYGVVRNDRLIGVVRDDLDVQYVVRVRLKEGER